MHLRALGVALLLLPTACGEPAAPATSAATTAREREPAASTPNEARPTAKQEAGQDRERVREAMKKMAGQSAELRQAFAAAAIAERTKGLVAESLRESFDKLQSMPPEMRRLTLMKGLATPEAAKAWTQACPAGPKVLADMAALAPPEQGKFLVTACKLSGDGLITPTEMENTDGIALAAALTAAHQVGKAEVERELLSFFLQASPSR